MSKIQLRGICQCCGREQAVVNGNMSKHGYTVEQGWFQGVCSGEHYAPMNVSREQTDKIVAAVRAEVVEILARVEDLKAGKIVPTEVKTDRMDPTTRKAVVIAWADASEYQRKQAVQRAIWNNEGRARQGEQFADYLEKKADQVFGTDLKEVKMDGKPQIEVGSKVKVNGTIRVVTKIGYAVARGVGPSLNGKSIEHVWFEYNGNEYKAPKRFARLVTE